MKESLINKMTVGQFLETFKSEYTQLLMSEQINYVVKNGRVYIDEEKEKTNMH